MNFVYLSPHFPQNYYPFCVHLNHLGVRVLGLADEPYSHLPNVLKHSLSEYYRVDDMHDYAQLLCACGYFTHHYGKIDRIESLNEYWLETEASLRTDFNVPGPHNDTIAKTKRKSEMKKVFQAAGIPVARGRIANNLDECLSFIEEVGYPIVAKPDIGVGAAHTYKLNTENELREFTHRKPGIGYILEEFLSGELCSFDGLADRDGNLAFYTSHIFSQGIMETVNEDLNLNYYSLREIPPDLINIGQQVARAFDVRERFFHFEFFRTKDNRLIAMEVNMRPPGGLTTDMFNYACDIDIYRQWANMVVFNRFESDYTRKYFCAYIGRKHNRTYQYSHAQIMAHWGKNIPHVQNMSPVFQAVMGQTGYIARSDDRETLMEIIHFIQLE